MKKWTIEWNERAQMIPSSDNRTPITNRITFINNEKGNFHSMYWYAKDAPDVWTAFWLSKAPAKAILEGMMPR